MLFTVSTLLRVLAAGAASIPFVAAQAPAPVTTEQLYGTLSSTAAPAPGFNAEGGSVFANYVNAVNDRQFFLLTTGSWVYEKPATEPVQYTFLDWCSDLTSSDLSNGSLIGYAGRCVTNRVDGYASGVAAGAQVSDTFSEGEFSFTRGVSAVYVEQLNVFEGQYHVNADDSVDRWFDDGSKTSPTIGWEGHDEGDMSANAATASWSLFGGNTWMTVEEVAQLLNTSTDEFTPEKFNQVYEDVWTKEHEKEAASDNPNAGAESEIIEEVKNEADSTDPATPIDGDSGTRRKLVSVAGRFVSASLRVFGI